MKKEDKLVKKVKRLLKRLGMPRWLHHFWPKTYEFYEHIVALIVKAFCKLSYRRTKQFLELLGKTCPSKSALQYTAAKLTKRFWERILRTTSSDPYLVALDSTGLSRTHPSYHYLKRINGKPPNMWIKLSCGFDTRKKKFCSAEVRIIPRHDSKDAKKLLSCHPKIAVADKAYNAESLYQFCAEEGILLMSPTKKNTRNAYARKKMHKKFRARTYNRRQLVESSFSAVKRKFGASVSSKKCRTIKTEIYSRLICHNLFKSLYRLLGQSPNCSYLCTKQNPIRESSS